MANILRNLTGKTRRKNAHFQQTKKNRRPFDQRFFYLVAGARFELTTFGL